MPAMESTGAHAAAHDPEPSLRTAVVGLIALTPAILFAVANVLRWELDIRSVGELAGPLVNGGSDIRTLLETWALLGPLVALLVTLPDAVSIRRTPGSAFGIQIRVASSAVHVVVIVTSIVVLALFAGYFAAESLSSPSFTPSPD
jgi:hypothetical protein